MRPAGGGGDEAVPDRPYSAVLDSGAADAATTHALERLSDGSFSGYAACGMGADGWVWSPSGAVTCGECADAAKKAISETEAP